MTTQWMESSTTFKKETTAKAFFILLSQLDLFLTLLAVYLGLTEINPFVRFLIGAPFLLVLIKMIIPIFLAWLMPGKLLLPSTIALAIVFIWNIKELVIYLV